jgi:hypothetical protein
MNAPRSIVAGAALLTLPAQAQDHRFEADHPDAFLALADEVIE